MNKIEQFINKLAYKILKRYSSGLRSSADAFNISFEGLNSDVQNKTVKATKFSPTLTGGGGLPILIVKL